MSITKNTITSRPAERGFSLVEVLVAMLILAIGLLGLAALQTLGVRFGNDAFVRTQGTTIAYDIIDKLRANRNNAANYTTASFPARQAPPPFTWDSPPYTCDPFTASVPNDLSCWLNSVELVLPLGQATITQQPAPNTSLYDITISWLDRQFQTKDLCDAQTNRTWTANSCLVNQTWTVWP